jgi:hypothetical protein
VRRTSVRAVEVTFAAFVLAAAVALAAGPATGAPLVTVRDGMLTTQIVAVPLADLKAELESVAAVDIRIASTEVAQHPVSASLAGEGIVKALEHMLRDFNFVQFTDTRSGRSVYLVTSLADPRAARTAALPEPGVAPALLAATAPGAANAASDQRLSTPRAMASASGSTPPRSLDQVNPIAPPTFDAYADQRIVEREMARVREDTLARAHSVLGNPANGPELQRQALNELVGLGDPRSLPTLMQLVNDNRVLDVPQAAEAVAQAAWRYAAQQQFANADANRLLQTIADSAQPQLRAVGEAALLDAQNFLAKNPSR